MTELLKEETDSKTEPELKKKRGRKKAETNSLSSCIGLFDHIKHIRSIQDPDYFKSLTELDLKSFNHFMILKSLSMNPALLEDTATLFKYFDKIPSPQFYKLLIGLIPSDKKYYPWIKSKKKQVNLELISLLTRYYEISSKEAEEYATLLLSTEKGRIELELLCKDFGLEDKEVEQALKIEDNKHE